ncbi:MAG: hypothetical protein U9R53_06835 [Chloroflexota bacterium]|nr:hypothetical protein [Chloroflexota bacterium]
MKIKTAGYYLIGLYLLILILTACAVSSDTPAQTVELYYQALVEKDQERLVNLSCSEWEATALLTLDSFSNVDASLVDVACETTEDEGTAAKVTCEGAISATYDGEAREFPLSGQYYRVIQEGGEWRMCGYE